MAETEASEKKPKRRLTAQRALVALGWSEKPKDSATPGGRGEDLAARLGVKGSALAALVWLGNQGVAVMNRQTAALEELAKASAANVKQSEAATAAIKTLDASSSLGAREQALTTREVGLLRTDVQKLEGAIWERRAGASPLPSADVPAPAPAPAPKPARPRPTAVPR